MLLLASRKLQVNASRLSRSTHTPRLISIKPSHSQTDTNTCKVQPFPIICPGKGGACYATVEYEFLPSEAAPNRPQLRACSPQTRVRLGMFGAPAMHRAKPKTPCAGHCVIAEWVLKHHPRRRRPDPRHSWVQRMQHSLNCISNCFAVDELIRKYSVDTRYEV